MRGDIPKGPKKVAPPPPPPKPGKGITPGAKTGEVKGPPGPPKKDLFSGAPKKKEPDIPVIERVNAVAKMLVDDERSSSGSRGTHAKHNLGFIYAVTLDSRPGFVKVGKTVDPKARLSTYQLNDPLEGYSMVFHGFVYEYSKAEKEAHRRLDEWHKNGEWFEVDLDVALDVLISIYTSTEYGIPEILEIERAA